MVQWCVHILLFSLGDVKREGPIGELPQLGSCGLKSFCIADVCASEEARKLIISMPGAQMTGCVNNTGSLFVLLRADIWIACMRNSCMVVTVATVFKRRCEC